MTTLASMTEIPRGEFVEHPDEILRRAEAGEDLVVTADGNPIADIHRHRPRPRGVSWDEFWSWPKTDREMIEVLREIRAESADDWADPWQRHGADR